MNKRTFQAIFVDRDGTLGGTGHFIHPKDFQLYEGVQEAIYRLKETGLMVIAITNQHRISRGQATIKEFKDEFDSYGFDDSFICPHSSIDKCECKKPNPGMLIAASKKYGLDLKRCVVIGDVGDTDMLAAHTVGALKVLVRTGWGVGSLGEYRYKWCETEPDFIASNFVEAVKWILKGKLDEGEYIT